jgi:hypothetical protein
MEKGEPRRPPAKPQFAAGVPASPQWKHDFTLTGEKVADRYAAVGYLEISVVRGGENVGSQFHSLRGNFDAKTQSDLWRSKRFHAHVAERQKQLIRKLHKASKFVQPSAENVSSRGCLSRRSRNLTFSGWLQGFCRSLKPLGRWGLIPEFESSHPDDAVHCEPVSVPKFPANREINREFCRFEALATF